jgi:hypothetical protein
MSYASPALSFVNMNRFAPTSDYFCPSANSTNSVPAAQRRVLERIRAESADYARRRDAALLSADGSTSAEAVSASDASDPYLFTRLVSRAIPLIADAVSLPKVSSTVGLMDLLPDTASPLYATSEALLRPPSVNNLPRPRRFCSQQEWIKLVRRLAAVSMVTFTTKPKVVNGVFGVPKDQGSIRFIVDARAANEAMVDPPPVCLPTPDLFAKLQASGPFVVAKSDLDNFYHRLRLPEWLQPYFAMPSVRAGDLDLADYAPDELVYPCCVTLPMGWSHSVYIAQTVHEHLLNTRTGLRPADRITADNDFRLDRPRHGVYIDDMIQLAPRQQLEELARLQLEYADAATEAGTPPKPSKQVPPTTRLIGLGLEINGDTGLIRLAADKLTILVNDTHAFCAQPFATGRQLAHLLGRWIWCCLVVRPAMSCFGSVFRFVELADTDSLPVWPSVRRELETIAGLAPLLSASVFASWCPDILATDASGWGQGVVATRATPEQCRLLAQELCGQRFSENDFPDDALASLRGVSWRTVVSSPWAYPEHINTLELRAASTAVRWILSRPLPSPPRLLLMSDSQVVVGVLSKGRSSSPQLLRRYRAIAALLLASGLQLSVFWVPSAQNPADRPSRHGLDQ